MKLTIEQAKALYFAPGALQEPPYTLYRFQRGDNRYYYSYQVSTSTKPTKQPKREVLKMYTSVTSFIKNTVPTSPFLIKWIAEKGYDAAHAFANMRAEYGTLMHKCFAQLTINKTFEFKTLPDLVDLTLQECYLPRTHREPWIEELEKDILAYSQFLLDYKIKPLAVEVVLCHPKDGYAGAVDLIAQAMIPVKGFHGEVYLRGGKNNKKDDPKLSTKDIEMVIILDFKSGKNGFYEDQEIQLEAYKQLAEKNFGFKIDRLYNFSPKDWKTSPGYNLKDQTESKARAKLRHLIPLMKIENERRRRNLIEIDGEIDLSKGIARNYRSVSIEDFIIGDFKEELVQVRGSIGEQVLTIKIGNVVHTSPPRDAGEFPYTRKDKAAFLRAIKKLTKPKKKKLSKQVQFSEKVVKKFKERQKAEEIEDFKMESKEPLEPNRL